MRLKTYNDQGVNYMITLPAFRDEVRKNPQDNDGGHPYQGAACEQEARKARPRACLSVSHLD